jgi:bacterioferritin
MNRLQGTAWSYHLLLSSKICTAILRSCSDSEAMNDKLKISRKQMIELLNEDLAREFQAIIAYTVYSQTLKGAAYSDIANELAVHAAEELSHALQIAKQIDYFNGTPVTVAKAVKMSDKPDDMLRFDLENERETILNYRERIRQAEAMGEFGLSEVLRKIIAQEQEHLTDLAGALGIDNPKIE